jgi:hypothetical protein
MYTTYVLYYIYVYYARVPHSMLVPVEEEIEKLLIEIKRLGQVDTAGKCCVKFGVLVRDGRP